MVFYSGAWSDPGYFTCFHNNYIRLLYQRKFLVIKFTRLSNSGKTPGKVEKELLITINSDVC